MNAHAHAVRRTLGIPDHAERVIVFAESSHWDPNWLLTSEEYYTWRIERILDEVVEALEQQPRRVFGIECLFFLRLYWDRRPDRQATVRRLVNEGRMRITGTGLTTPDTNLPHAEAILRDYLLGQEWLRRNGMTVEPALLYLPDSFGHTPALPSIARALGVDMVAVTRIDGMAFIGSDFRPASDFPLAGSSADALSRLGTQTFVWRAPDGAEVLGHWNAFTYFHGDMLAHRGIIRWMGLAFGVPWRTRGHVRRRIERFSRELQGLSRTPYLLCTIGCDFNGPIPGLVDLLDRYNRHDYPHTGVWAVNAGMDDYMRLAGAHREALPVVSLDPNPYWMGSHASRPAIKRRCNRLAHTLMVSEKLACAKAITTEGADVPEAIRRDLDAGWELVALSNHHDFITGTSPDRVFLAEQCEWLERAERHARRALAAAGAGHEPLPLQPGADLSWRLHDGRVHVEGPHYRLEISERQGGCITSLRRQHDGTEWLAGPSNDLCAYVDSGGLWRMGHEYRGGRFAEIERASRGPARVSVTSQPGRLHVRVESVLAGRPVTRFLELRGDTPVIRMKIIGMAGLRRTVTCRFHPALRATSLRMDVPGGAIERPQRRIYDPTFWAARSFASVSEDERAMVAMLGGPACVALRGDGAMEWVALRNAPRETAFGILPLPAHPASGTDHDANVFDYAVTFADEGTEPCWSVVAERVLSEAWLEPEAVALAGHADRLIAVDRADVRVVAVKPASRGHGFVARLQRLATGPARAELVCPARNIRAASLCDALERDREPLRVQQGRAEVPLESTLTSVRFSF
jgi:hypothetical protein